MYKSTTICSTKSHSFIEWTLAVVADYCSAAADEQVSVLDKLSSYYIIML